MIKGNQNFYSICCKKKCNKINLVISLIYRLIKKTIYSYFFIFSLSCQNVNNFYLQCTKQIKDEKLSLKKSISIDSRANELIVSYEKKELLNNIRFVKQYVDDSNFSFPYELYRVVAMYLQGWNSRLVYFCKKDFKKICVAEKKINIKINKFSKNQNNYFSDKIKLVNYIQDNLIGLNQLLLMSKESNDLKNHIIIYKCVYNIIKILNNKQYDECSEKLFLIFFNLLDGNDIVYFLQVEKEDLSQKNVISEQNILFSHLAGKYCKSDLICNYYSKYYIKNETGFIRNNSYFLVQASIFMKSISKRIDYAVINDILKKYDNNLILTLNNENDLYTVFNNIISFF